MNCLPPPALETALCHVAHPGDCECTLCLPTRRLIAAWPVHGTFCGCEHCLRAKVARIDAFAEGLLAGLAAAPETVEGPQRVGAPVSYPQDVFGASSSPTRRPPPPLPSRR